ncbi:hypothetical protein Ddye_014291 [Dipteronia dyeriana]|uniref:Uncharacterized protein n=1 Tax=Dipteronia dyeriana TaxID=168575 RepID=A0AAD9X7S2_9ROSI|nr:hypothetical protein Ddye_014291 [Dipteronia dyeriana]
MQIGTALGFDFRGLEKDLAEVLARRETEDEVHVKEVKGFQFISFLLVWGFLFVMIAITWNISLALSWCISGDFNTVLEPSERLGVGCNMGSIRNFTSFVLQSKVVDIPLSGASFTWSNNRVKASWSALPRSLSDHCAIMIGEKKIDWGPCPFRFCNSWLEKKPLMQEDFDGWKGCNVRGSKSVNLAAEVQSAKNRMKKWLKVNCKATSSSKDLESDLTKIDSRASLEGWSEKLCQDHMVLLAKLWMEF